MHIPRLSRCSRAGAEAIKIVQPRTAPGRTGPLFGMGERLPLAASSSTFRDSVALNPCPLRPVGGVSALVLNIFWARERVLNPNRGTELSPYSELGHSDGK
jgi:hypothetical protein